MPRGYTIHYYYQVRNLYSLTEGFISWHGVFTITNSIITLNIFCVLMNGPSSLTCGFWLSPLHHFLLLKRALFCSLFSLYLFSLECSISQSWTYPHPSLSHLSVLRLGIAWFFCPCHQLLQTSPLSKSHSSQQMTLLYNSIRRSSTSALFLSTWAQLHLYSRLRMRWAWKPISHIDFWLLPCSCLTSIRLALFLHVSPLQLLLAYESQSSSTGGPIMCQALNQALGTREGEVPTLTKAVLH